MFKEKNISISIIRFIAFIMIVLCHIFQGLNIPLAFWFNIGVQIFLFISGYLYGQKKFTSYIDFYKKRLIKILIPFLILVITMLFVDKIFLNTTYPNFTIIANLIGLGAWSANLKELSHTWFIGYILICYLITPLLDMIFKKKKNKKYILWIILISIILEYFYVTNINPAYLCNYILGFWFAKCLNKREKNKFSLIIIFISLFTLPLKIITYYKLLPLPNIISVYSNDIWDWTHTFIGISIFVILYKLLENTKIKHNKILLFSDKYSFYIYLTHQIFILNSFSLLHITNNIIINILLILVCIIISGIILNKLSTLIELLINKIIQLKNRIIKL